MLTDLFDALVGALDETADPALGSALNSGSTPNAGPTATGTVTVNTDATSPDLRPPRESGGDGDRNLHDPNDPNYERNLQVDNAVDTGVGLATEVVAEWLLTPFKNIGKVASPLITIVSATDTAVDGIRTVAGYHADKWARINEQSGGAFDEGSGGGGGEDASSESGSGSSRGEEEMSDYVRDVLENSRIKAEIWDTERRMHDIHFKGRR